MDLLPTSGPLVSVTGNGAVGGEGREGLCLQLPHSLSPALGLIVPSTQTHPVGTIRRSDGNPPFQVSALSNGAGGWAGA
jgi:hypothetical protein